MKILTLLAGVLLSLSVSASETTKLILPVGVGGLIHKYALDIEPMLAKELNSTIVMDFKPGANGIIGARALVESKSDKLTLMMGPPHNWKNLSDSTKSIDPINDMVPVAFLGTVPGVIFAKPNNKFKNFKEAIEYSKRISITYGIPQASANLPLFRKIAKNYTTENNFVEVLYKSGGPVTMDVLGGHIDIGVTVNANAAPYFADGTLIPLAVFSSKRSRNLPNVPTLQELGVGISDEFKYYNNVFLWANKNADPVTIDRLRNSIDKYMSSDVSLGMRIRQDIQMGNKSIKAPEKYLKELLSDE
jgi:hypothetical protein